EAVQSQLCSSRRGHDRDTLQCRVKVKELQNAYHKAREANRHSGAAPMSCRFYKELDVILGGDPHLYCEDHCGYFSRARANREWTKPGGGNLGQGRGGKPRGRK
ncbi:hypothetical protein G0U57_006231, partial [Chelydra serpentina]